MSQPRWKFLANLGDAHPLDHDGYFVYEDETGVYPAEAEYLMVDNPDEKDDDRITYLAYRVILERCTFINGVLSDNKFHPDHPAWFATPESRRTERPRDTTYLSCVSDCCDVPAAALAAWFCSDDPLVRAEAYRCVGEYHGWENLDDYPLRLSRAESRERYRSQNGVDYR